MNELPEPLTPPDCDLRGLEWMPLYGDRLFSSETWLMASPDGRCAALALWWAAWKQCPAGSLPDQDRALAQLAGFGSMMKSWIAVKNEAIRGWVRCSDGRLYHPVVCGFAMEAWDRRVKERGRKAAYRAKREGQDAAVPRDTTGTNTGQDTDKDGDCHVEKTGQDRTGQDRTFKKEREERPIATQSPSASRGMVVSGGPDFDAFWEVYPRKIGKDAARKAFIAACKRATAADIIEGCRWYAFKPEAEFQPHAATWLNQGRWQVEPDTAPVTVMATGRERDKRDGAGQLIDMLEIDILAPMSSYLPEVRRIENDETGD